MTTDTQQTTSKRSRLFLSLAALALLMITGLILAAWLLGSTAGSRWLLSHASLPESVDFELSDGSLWSGIEFTALKVRTDTVVFGADRGFIKARPMGFMSGITLNQIVLENATAQLMSSTREERPLEPLNPADWGAPLPVVLQQGEIRGLSVLFDEGADIVFGHVDLSGRWDTGLSDVRLSAVSDFLNIDVNGDLRLAGGQNRLQLQASLDAQKFDPALPPDLHISASTVQGLNHIDLLVASEIDGLRASGNLADLLSEPNLALDIELNQLDLPADEEAIVTLVQVQGRVDLSMQQYRLDLQGGLESMALEDVPAPFAWEAILSGALAGEGLPDDGHVIALEKLNMALGESRLQANGEIQTGTSADQSSLLNLNLDWQSLQWPLVTDTPGLMSDEGSGRLTGELDNWSFAGEFALATPEYPGGRLNMIAHGDAAGARFEALEGALLGGSLNGQGNVAWGDEAAASLDLSFSTLDLARVLPDWPAVVSGETTVSLNWQETVQAQINVAQLSGRMFGEALAFSGDIFWQADGFEISEASLLAGTSRIETDLFLGQEWYGNLELDIRGPGWLARRAGGEWLGRIELDNRQDFPVLSADLSGRNIALDGLGIGRVNLQFEEVSGKGLSLEATDVDINGTEIDEITLQYLVGETGASGKPQLLTVTASRPGWTVLAASRGELFKSGTLEETAWTGSLETAQLMRGEQETLRLLASAPLELAADRVILREACFEPQTEGTLCLSYEQEPGRGLDIVGEFQALSLALLTQLPVGGLGSTQVLDGPFNWSWQSGGLPEGSADLRLSEGNIYDTNADEFDIEVGAGSLGFSLTEGTLRNGRIDLPIPGSGYIRSSFEIDGVKLDGTGQLRGDLDVTLENLQVLDEFIDQVRDLNGTLRLEMQLSGVTSDPKLDGVFDLSDVSLLVPALGTQISALTVRGRVDDGAWLTLRGPFQVGEGTGSLSVNAQISDWNNPGLDIRLLGDQLAVARLPDLSLDMSPDIRLIFADDRWQVSGSAHIPQATISPLTIGVERVDESPDVVIVAGQLPEVQERAAPRPVQIYGGVGVTLGNAVRVAMDNVDLGLTGGAELQWEGEMVPTARGQVLVNGDVTAWGPRLQINGGRVRWSGEAVSNPMLDVRAERDVFGNTLVRTVGVRVSGPAQNIDVEAVTNPLTTTERAWAILLTGSDVNFAQGVGAFDVGTYIAPRIFLSYGISFFDSENVLGIRFDLRRGWGVKATSGQQDSGIDISYTIEN